MPAAQFFISYRRSTDEAEAGRLQDAIAREFGPDAVFRDESIRIGTKWSDSLDVALAGCSTVLAVIGPDWLLARDDYGHRRIDQEDDWVRLELSRALEGGKKLIPVFLGDMKVFPPEALPEPVRGLLEWQGYWIRERYFEHDVRLILRALSEDFTGEQSTGGGYSLYPVPAPPAERPHPMSDEQLDQALAGSLRDWERVETERADRPGDTTVELHRAFRFRSFGDAIAFMGQVAPGCDIAIHHPRWQNVWKTVDVWLSTWDLDRPTVTDRDIQLAKYFNKAFDDFPGALPQGD